MKLIYRLLVLCMCALFYTTVHAQAPCTLGQSYRGCKACGTAGSNKGRMLNVQKNRGTAVTNPHKVTVAQIRNPSNNSAFSPNHQVWVIGYVASVESGGKQETCNCGRPDLRDIHINIVANSSEANDKTKYVVVEFTPRWEHNFNLDDTNYDAMLQKVRQQIEGRWVRFEGWMMYDYIHADESKSTALSNVPTCKDDGTDPEPCVWRGTPWEVHPVTKYAVVPGP